MDELPADVLAAATGDPEPEPFVLEDTVRALIPLADSVRATLADIALVPVAQATPEQRSQLIALRSEIARVQRDTTTWLDAIDHAFRHAAQQLEAKEIPTANGVVRIEPPRGEWIVDVQALRRELAEAARNGGPLSAEEVDSIFKTTVEEKADGTKLNYFARNRGVEIAEIIGRHRRFVPGNPLAAKLRFHEKGGDD